MSQHQGAVSQQAHNGTPGASWAQRGRTQEYTPEEQQQVELAKHKHGQTTEATERAARTALETRTLAADVHVALQDQGEQLERINRDLDYVEGDNKEAGSTLKDMRWMRRCCCCCLTLFSCCCSCDPHTERDKTRKARVKARKQDRKVMAEGAQASKEARRQRAAAEPGGLRPQQPEEAQRAQLFDNQPGSIARGRDGASGGPQGGGLDEEDAEWVRRNTAEQNRNLDVVGDAAADIKRLAYGIEAETQRQMPVVDATADRVGEARAGVRDTARQTFNYRTGR